MLHYSGTREVQTLDFFKSCYYNTRMQKVYNEIRAGSIPAKEQLDWTDSLGFTPLHYALILRREDVVSELLEKHTWKSPVFTQSSDNAMELLDYTVLACCVGISSRADIFQKTSDIVTASLRSKKALEKRLWLKQRKLDVQVASERKAKEIIHQARRNHSYDKVDEYQIKLETVQTLKLETLEEIAEINDSIYEIECEIQEMTDDALIQAVGCIQQLRQSANPMAKYLFRIFEEDGLLYHILSDCLESCRLYTYGKIVFATPVDIIIELPYQEHRIDEEKSKKSGDRQTESSHYNQDESQKRTGNPVVRPYGESWFSPQAHQDMHKLKEEYHVLAKKYHPDRCQHPRSKEIFQEILNERATILEHMS